MREILFRGKREYTGEWIEGYLYITQRGQYEISRYSKSYDWPVTTTKEDVKRNINYILERNELLKEECKKYNFRLVNTSREDNRNKILNDLVEEAMKE